MASSNISMLGKTGNNAQSDECYTPRYGLYPLLKYLDARKTYYEPTSLISTSIVDSLNDWGLHCTRARGDFFKVNIWEDVIISNPPYSMKDKFLRKCFELEKPFALLLPVSAIQGQRRGDLFRKYGVDLLVYDNRIDFTGGGSPHFGNMWVTHGILPDKLIFEDNWR